MTKIDFGIALVEMAQENDARAVEAAVRASAADAGELKALGRLLWAAGSSGWGAGASRQRQRREEAMAAVHNWQNVSGPAGGDQRDEGGSANGSALPNGDETLAVDQLWISGKARNG